MTDQVKTQKYIKKIRPDFVIIAAAKVGGIYANQKYKANFLYQNLMIQTKFNPCIILSRCKKINFFGLKLYLSKICKNNLLKKNIY